MAHTKSILLGFALILCVFIQASFAVDPPFPSSVIKEMASRQMRYHHFLWHQIRDNWNRFSESTKDQFRKINWAPPNPSKDSKGQTIMTNLAGEEFLYMHRQMIAKVNQIIAQNKDPYGKIKGWTTVPAPGDKTYPVPPPFKQGSNPQSLANFKTDDYYYTRIQKAEKFLKDPAQLRKMTLNELGKKIESGIHNDMHMRWAAYSPVGYRGGGSLNNGLTNINKQWDDPKYNWLVDTYSSHVNPIFWKLHGWIDARVEDWRRAHGLSSIKWKGTWTGGPMSSLSSVMKTRLGKGPSKEDPEAIGDMLQKAMNIFMESGVKESKLGDPVVFAPQPAKKSKSRSCKSTKAKKASH